MRALTLHRPWPWAIFHLPEEQAKRVENRTWAPPITLRGERFAIHAGKTWDIDGWQWIQNHLGISVPMEDEHPTGIIGTVRLAGQRDLVSAAWWYKEGGYAFATPDKPFALPAHDGGRWFCGPFGWLLDDVRALPEPIPCRGAQGLWTVPAEIEARIERTK